MKLIVFGDFKLENIKNESHVQKKKKKQDKVQNTVTRSKQLNS